MSKPGWAAILAGKPNDLRQWERVLLPVGDPWVEPILVNGDVRLALRSSGFEGIGTAADVRTAATTLVERLSGAIRIQEGVGEPMRVDAICHIDDQGCVSTTFFVELHDVVSASDFCAIAEMRDAAGNLVPLPLPAPPEPSPAQNWIQFAASDERVARMLTFAGKPGSWYDIYKAYELALRIVGRDQLKNLLGRSASACENMRQTANYYRHANGEPYEPPVLTSLSDAGSLLSLVLRAVFNELRQRGYDLAALTRDGGVGR